MKLIIKFLAFSVPTFGFQHRFGVPIDSTMTPVLQRKYDKGFRHYSSIFSTSGNNLETFSREASEMKVKEIQVELRDRGVSYYCFDKESLVKRLRDARDGKVTGKEQRKQQGAESPPETDSSKSSSTSVFDRRAVMSELRKLRVSELRTRLGERGIRWSNMIEKEDLVVALAKDMEASANFSISGSLTPGKVTDVTADQLSAELDSDIEASTPLILDGEYSRIPS